MYERDEPMNWLEGYRTMVERLADLPPKKQRKIVAGFRPLMALLDEMDRADMDFRSSLDVLTMLEALAVVYDEGRGMEKGRIEFTQSNLDWQAEVEELLAAVEDVDADGEPVVTTTAPNDGCDCCPDDEPADEEPTFTCIVVVI